jgi:spermidine synthase
MLELELCPEILAIFGDSDFAHAALLASVMSGSALGNLFIGMAGDRTSHGLRLYGGLRIAAGGLIALALPGLACLTGWLQHVGIDPAASAGHAGVVGRVVIMFSLVPIFFVVGGTYSLLSRTVAGSVTRFAPAAARLGASAAVGAVVGSITGGVLVFLDSSAVWGLRLAVALNVGVGTALMWSTRRYRIVPQLCKHTLRPETDRIPRYGGVHRLLAMAMAMVAGIATMSYELCWVQALLPVWLEGDRSFTVMVVSVLIGLAIGGWLAAWLLHRWVKPWSLLGVIELGIALLVLVSFPLFPFLADLSRHVDWLHHPLGTASLLAASFLPIALPAVLIGAAFPVILRICVSTMRRSGGSMGRAIAFNSVGNLTGALLVGLWLIPYCGADVVRGWTILTSAVLGVLALLTSRLAAPQGLLKEEVQ